MIHSFKYPEIKREDREYQFGSVDPVNPSGDWNTPITPFEEQRINNVEPSDCYVQASQSAIASYLELLYNIKDSDFLADFNALLSNGTPTGGDPLKGAYSIKNDGLIPQSMRDRTGLQSWDEYHSWKGMDKDKCIAKGKEEARQTYKKYKIISEKGDSLEDKYAKLKDGLTRYACVVSVAAWFERDGKYYKPKGYDDTHLVQVLSINENNEITIKDTYAPHIKVLEANTDFDFSMGWVIRKKSPEEILNDTQKSLIIILMQYVANLLKQFKKVAGEIITGVFSKRQD